MCRVMCKHRLVGVFPHAIIFCSSTSAFCFLFFPDCIGLDPPSFGSAPGKSDYKNFTLNFYKLDSNWRNESLTRLVMDVRI